MEYRSVIKTRLVELVTLDHFKILNPFKLSRSQRLDNTVFMGINHNETCEKIPPCFTISHARINYSKMYMNLKRN